MNLRDACVEAAREVGGRELLKIPVTWPAKGAPQSGKAQGGRLQTMAPTETDEERTKPGHEPWLIMIAVVMVWTHFKVATFFAQPIQWPGLHNLIYKMPPVVTEPHLEAAIYKFNQRDPLLSLPKSQRSGFHRVT
mgnify:CR=1 FL=1